MSFYDLMRRFFGIPYHAPRDDYLSDHFTNPIWGDEDNDDETDDEFRNVPSSPFGFKIFTGDPLDLHRFFEYQFDEMLKNFRAMEGSIFGSGLTELPDFGMPGALDDKPSEESIRDKYLKPSFEKRSLNDKKDSDIDDEITKADLKALLPSGPSMGHDVPARVFGQSIITKTIRLPGGRVEERKTVRGTRGEEVTVRRRLGDQEHTVTTTTTPDGKAEITEEFVNLDQDKLPDFEKEWQGMDRKGMDYRKPAVSPPQYEDDNATTIAKIFDKFFK